MPIVTLSVELFARRCAQVCVYTRSTPPGVVTPAHDPFSVPSVTLWFPIF